MSIHKRIKYFRKKADVTQEYVAKLLGIGTANYAKYESGERNPKDNRITALAKILNVSFNSIKIGDECVAIDLLNRHLRGAVIGDIDGFNAFFSDFYTMGNVYETIMVSLRGWGRLIQEKYSSFYSDFLECPNLASIVELNKRYLTAFGGFNQQHYESNGDELMPLSLEHMFNDDALDDATIYKIAFCIAAERYIDLEEHGSFSVDFILSDVRDYLEARTLSDAETMQQFSIMVFVPFLDHILNTLELIEMNNSNLDDFALAFLHNEVTFTEADEEDTNSD